MQVDRANEARVRQYAAIIDADAGKRAFYRAMALTDNQVAVTGVEVERLNSVLVRRESAGLTQNRRDKVVAVAAQDEITSFVMDVLVSVLKIPIDQLNVATPFEKYGVDSIVQAKLIQEMESTLGELPKTLLFEHTTIRELVEFLTQHYFPGTICAACPFWRGAECTGNGRVGNRGTRCAKIGE